MRTNYRVYREGSYGIMSGSPYAVLEVLRREGVVGSNRILAMCPANASYTDIFVAFYTGAKNILSSMVNWFTFDNASSAGVCNDKSGITTTTLTYMSGAVSGTGVDNVISGAMFLSGVMQAYNVSGHAVITVADTQFLTNKGTICAWINPGVCDRNNTIYEYSRAPGQVHALIFYTTVGINNNGTIGYTYRDGDNTIANNRYLMVSGATALTAGTWAHVAVTSDGNEISLYVNGSKENAVVSGTNSGQWFGDMSTSGTWIRQAGVSIISGVYRNHYNGFIDNLRIADFAMSEEQIRQLYESKM